MTRAPAVALALLATLALAGCGAVSSHDADNPATSTLRATWVDRNGDGTLERGPGEPMWRAPSSRPPRAPWARWPRWAFVTDVHVRDPESPARRRGSTGSGRRSPRPSAPRRRSAARCSRGRCGRSTPPEADGGDRGRRPHRQRPGRRARPGAAHRARRSRAPGLRRARLPGPAAAADPDPAFYRPGAGRPGSPTCWRGRWRRSSPPVCARPGTRCPATTTSWSRVRCRPRRRCSGWPPATGGWSRWTARACARPTRCAPIRPRPWPRCCAAGRFRGAACGSRPIPTAGSSPPASS